MDLSIIIVNWNSAGYLQKCLKSIFGQSLNLNFEVIVIDNGSFDESEALIEEEFHGVIYLQSDRNLGFSAANNLAYQHCRGSKVLFLNPDTEIMGNCIQTLSANLDSQNDTGAIGARLLNQDLSLQTSCIQSFPTILNQVLDSAILRRFFPKLRLWGTRPLFQAGRNVSEVEVVSGACLMVKRSVFETVNLFSEDYFMYCEDVDLCYKIIQRGYKILFASNALVIHYGGGCTKEKSDIAKAAILLQESKSKFIIKTKGHSYQKIYRICICVVAVLRLALISAPLWGVKVLRRGPKFDMCFLKWASILKWSLGLHHETGNNVRRVRPGISRSAEALELRN